MGYRISNAGCCCGGGCRCDTQYQGADLAYTITNATGDCTCLDTSGIAVWSDIFTIWEFYTGCTMDVCNWTLGCNSLDSVLTLTTGGSCASVEHVSSTCSPLEVIYDITVSGQTACGDGGTSNGSFTITFTEISPLHLTQRKNRVSRQQAQRILTGFFLRRNALLAQRKKN